MAFNRSRSLNEARRYRQTLDDQFDKLKSSGRKARDRKWTRKPDLESAFDRLDKKEKESRKLFTFQDPNALERYRMSYFFVQWYHAWLIDARETVGISYFRQTKMIILW